MKKSLQIPLVLTLAAVFVTTGCQQTSQQRRTAPAVTEMEAPAQQPQPAPAAARENCTDPTRGLVSLAKQMPKEAMLGETFEYQLTMSSQDCVDNVIVNDRVPAGASYVKSEPAATVTEDLLTWRLPQMDAGQKATIRVWLKADKEGTLSSCATITADPRVCAATFVGKPTLSIEKSGPATALLGSTVPYNVVVANQGNAVAKDVVLTDPVPEGMGGSPVTVSLGDLAPAQSKATTVNFTATQRGTFTNTATATSTNAGTVNALAVTVVLQPGLKITKEGTKEQILGRNADYQIVVSNSGDTALNNVVVTDTAPAETSIVEAPGATVSGNTATWTIPELPPGNNRTFTTRLTSQTAGTHRNNVTASAAGLSEMAAADTLWKGVAAVGLEVTDDPDPIQVGETTTYTFKVTNQGFADIHNVKIVGTFDDGLTPIGSSGGTITGKTVTSRTVATMAPKEVLTGTLTLRGDKVGDSRSRFVLTCDELTTPVEESESTHVY